MKNVYIVTGAAGGIGLEIAKQFTEGIILLADISEDNLKKAKPVVEKPGVEVKTHIVDLSDKESIETLINVGRELGNIKTLVNSAGVSGDQAKAKLLFEINLLGTQHLIEQAKDHMNEGSSIVLVSSMMGHSVPDDITYTNLLTYPEEANAIDMLVEVINDDSTLAYNFSKRGVHNLTKRYAYELGKKGVRINSVSPGIIRTAMSEQAEREHPEQMEQMKLMTPMSRMGEVKDIANVVMYLASEQAAYITGTDILADGGLIIKILENA